MSIDPGKPHYLGDGLYVMGDSGMIKLYVSDGERETNVVYLEPHVYRNFLEWCRLVGMEHRS